MKPEFVVDANVVVKVLVPEDYSDVAIDLLSAPFEALAPAHCLAEVFEVLQRKRRAGMIDSQTLRIAPRILAGRIGAAPLAQLAPSALRLAEQLAITVYDAFYLALAEEADVPLVTADQKLITAVGRSDLSRLVVHLRDARSAGLVTFRSIL